MTGNPEKINVDEPLLYWELNDDTDKKKTSKIVKIMFCVLLGIALLFGLWKSSTLQTSQATNALIMNDPEVSVGESAENVDGIFGSVEEVANGDDEDGDGDDEDGDVNSGIVREMLVWLDVKERVPTTGHTAETLKAALDADAAAFNSYLKDMRTAEIAAEFREHKVNLEGVSDVAVIDSLRADFTKAEKRIKALATSFAQRYMMERKEHEDSLIGDSADFEDADGHHDGDGCGLCGAQECLGVDACLMTGEDYGLTCVVDDVTTCSEGGGYWCAPCQDRLSNVYDVTENAGNEYEWTVTDHMACKKDFKNLGRVRTLEEAKSVFTSPDSGCAVDGGMMMFASWYSGHAKEWGVRCCAADSPVSDANEWTIYTLEIKSTGTSSEEGDEKMIVSLDDPVAIVDSKEYGINAPHLTDAARFDLLGPNGNEKYDLDYDLIPEDNGDSETLPPLVDYEAEAHEEEEHAESRRNLLMGGGGFNPGGAAASSLKSDKSRYATRTLGPQGCPPGWRYGYPSVYMNNDVGGNGIIFLPRSTVRACANSCAATSNCEAFMFGWFSQHRKNYCKLSTVVIPNRHSGTWPVRMCEKVYSCPGGGWVNKGGKTHRNSITGSHLILSVTASSQNNCRDRCKANSECQAFSYTHGNRNCKLGRSRTYNGHLYQAGIFCAMSHDKGHSMYNYVSHGVTLSSCSLISDGRKFKQTNLRAKRLWRTRYKETYLTDAINPISCQKLCYQGMSRELDNCFFDACTGECWVGATSQHLQSTTNGARYLSFWRDVNPALDRSNVHTTKEWHGNIQRYIDPEFPGNIKTHYCSKEGNWCDCQGIVTYAPDTLKNFDAVRAKDKLWKEHRRVRGGVQCENKPHFFDMSGGKSKRCWCSPESHEGIPPAMSKITKWTERGCKLQFSSQPGWIVRFHCWVACPVALLDASVDVECPHACWCLAKGWTN